MKVTRIFVTVTRNYRCIHKQGHAHTCVPTVSDCDLSHSLFRYGTSAVFNLQSQIIVSIFFHASAIGQIHTVDPSIDYEFRIGIQL